MAKQATRLQPGQKFNRWTILEFLRIRQDANGRNTEIYLMRCDCGTVKENTKSQVKNGYSKSCGCLQKEAVTQALTRHGQSGGFKKYSKASGTYRAWKAMIARCTSKTNERHIQNYQSRGIKVCDRWRSFEEFHKDMGDRPEGMTLDRINVNGNYEPSNCRWASYALQARNKRTNNYLKWGDKTQCMEDWSRELNVPVSTLRARIKRGGIDYAFSLIDYKPRNKKLRGILKA